MTVAILGIVTVGPAWGASFDFEDQPVDTSQNGSNTSIVMIDSGLTVTITRSSGASFDVLNPEQAGFPGPFPDAYPVNWGQQALSPVANNDVADFFIATFSELVFSFSLEAGDFGMDPDEIFLEAFSGIDGTGISLGTDSIVWNGDFGLNTGDPSDPPVTLSVASGQGFRSVIFYSRSDDPDFVFSTYFDNLMATTVPEPSSALLLGLGLAGFAAVRRRTH